MPSFKHKTNKKIILDEKTITTLDGKHKEVEKEFGKEQTEILPELRAKRKHLTKLLENGNTNMTIYVNDTAGNLNSTFINWSYTYIENNRTHNTTSFETASEIFSINVEGATTANLFYNGTEYTATKSGNILTPG